MRLPRRRFLHLAAGAAAFPAASRFAFALDYPTRPVRIFVGFPPGAATDIVARLLAQSLSDRLGQQFVRRKQAGRGQQSRRRNGRSSGARRLYASGDDRHQRGQYDAL